MGWGAVVGADRIVEEIPVSVTVDRRAEADRIFGNCLVEDFTALFFAPVEDIGHTWPYLRTAAGDSDAADVKCGCLRVEKLLSLSLSETFQ